MMNVEEELPQNTYEPVAVNGDIVLSNEQMRVTLDNGRAYRSYFAMDLQCRARPMEEPTPTAFILNPVGPRNTESDNDLIIVKMRGCGGNVFIPELKFEYKNNDDRNNLTESGGLENDLSIDYRRIRRNKERDNHTRILHIDDYFRRQNQGGLRSNLIQDPRSHRIERDARVNPIQDPRRHPVGDDARRHFIQYPPVNPIPSDSRDHPIQDQQGQVTQNRRDQNVLEQVRKPNQNNSVGSGNPNQNNPRGPQIFRNPRGGRREHGPQHNIRGDPESSRVMIGQGNNIMQNNNRGDPQGHRVLHDPLRSIILEPPREHEAQDYFDYLENNPGDNYMQNNHPDPHRPPVFNLQRDPRFRHMQNNSRGSHGQNNACHQSEEYRYGIRMRDDLRNRNDSNGLSSHDTLQVLHIDERFHDGAVETGFSSIMNDKQDNCNRNASESHVKRNYRDCVMEDVLSNTLIQDEPRSRCLKNTQDISVKKKSSREEKHRGYIISKTQAEFSNTSIKTEHVDTKTDDIRVRQPRNKLHGSPIGNHLRGRTKGYTQRNSRECHILEEPHGITMEFDISDIATQNSLRSRDTETNSNSSTIQSASNDTKIDSSSRTPTKEEEKYVRYPRNKLHGSPGGNNLRGRTKDGFTGRYTQRNSREGHTLEHSHGITIEINISDNANSIQSDTTNHSGSRTPVQINPGDISICEDPQNMSTDDYA